MVSIPWFTVSIVAVSFSITSGLPVPSHKVLHRVVRQFDPSQFLNPNFVALGGLFTQGQQFQQTGTSSSSTSIKQDNSTSSTTGDAGQTQAGGSSSGGSKSSGAFSFFSPAQFFLQPNQKLQMSGSLSASSSASQGSSPYFSVGVAPFSNLISPSQFINPRDKVQYNTEIAADGTMVTRQNFTGNAAGGPDPSGPVGQTGDSGDGENFKPPNFFLNPGSSF